MNILVTGALGQLGRELMLVSMGSKDSWFFTDVLEQDGVDVLDITDPDAVCEKVEALKINVIVNCAAYTNVDKAESDRQKCELINCKAPQYLAEAMKKVGGMLVHISTDYIFGQKQYNTPIVEDCVGAPSGVYGLSKLHGEQSILDSGANYLILRSGWLYSPFGKNFVKTILTLAATQSQLKVVFDQVGSPTYAADLAKAIFDILEQRMYIGNYGIYNYSNEGVCSWYDFAKAISFFANLTNCDIQPCHSEEYPSPVCRPFYSVLDKSKFKATFGTVIPYWVDSLKLFFDRINSNCYELKRNKNRKEPD